MFTKSYLTGPPGFRPKKIDSLSQRLLPKYLCAVSFFFFYKYELCPMRYFLYIYICQIIFFIVKLSRYQARRHRGGAGGDRPPLSFAHKNKNKQKTKEKKRKKGKGEERKGEKREKRRRKGEAK